MAMLEVKNLQVKAEDKADPPRHQPHGRARAKCTPSWGPTARARARSRARWPGIPATKSPAARSATRARTCSTWPPDERAREGVFMAFQYPVEIPGVNNAYFLKAALNARRKQQGLEELDAIDFMAFIREKAKLLQVDEAMLQRSVNEGFSGGEKKRNEIFHMAVLEPRLAILDETDSGLDIDALKIVASGVNAMRSPDRSFIVVTHYQRLLNYIVPDYVHVLSDGLLVRSGGRELALELEEKGYGWLEPHGRGGVSACRQLPNGSTRCLAEHGRFTQGRGASAPPWLRELRAARRRALCRAGLSRPCGRKSGGSPTSRPIADTPFRLAEAAPTNAARAGRRASRFPAAPRAS